MQNKTIPFYLCTALGVCLSDTNAANKATPSTTPLSITVTTSPTDNRTQSSSTIHTDEATKIGSDRLEDFADYLPGVQTGRFQAGIGSDLYLRGFPLGGRFFIDGLLDKQGYFVRDPATVEKTDVLMGTDSVLFGSGSPGGVVNFISKQPLFTPHSSLKLETGSPARQRLVVDSTRPLSKGSDWAYRTILIQQQADTGQENVSDDRLTLFPSLLYQTERDKWLLEAEFNRQQREYDFDHVFVNGSPVYNVSYVDPRTEAQRDSLRLSSHYDTHPAEDLTVQLAASWIGMKRYDQLAGFYYLDSEDAPLPGYYRRIHENTRQYHLRAELEKHGQTGSMSHTTRAGLEKQHAAVDTDSADCADCFQLDIFNPTFDYPLPSVSELTPDNYRTTTDEKALFLRHTLTTGSTTVTAGIRHSWLDGSKIEADTGRLSGESDTQDTQTSVGFTHRLSPSWQVFANHNESLLPNGGHDRDGDLLPPRHGVQHELGLRYRQAKPHGKPLKAAASLYRIEQDNLTVRDPVDRNARLIAGEANVHGVEVKLKTPLTPQLDLEAAYNHTDTHLMQKGATTRLHNAPHHSGSLKLDYAPNERTELFLGATYAGERPGDDANSFEVPAYTRLDAGAAWKLNRKTTLTAGVRNLLDEDYVASVEAVDFVVQGRKRTVTVGLEMEF